MLLIPDSINGVATADKIIYRMADLAAEYNRVQIDAFNHLLNDFTDDEFYDIVTRFIIRRGDLDHASLEHEHLSLAEQMLGKYQRIALRKALGL